MSVSPLSMDLPATCEGKLPWSDSSIGTNSSLERNGPYGLEDTSNGALPDIPRKRTVSARWTGDEGGGDRDTTPWEPGKVSHMGREGVELLTSSRSYVHSPPTNAPVTTWEEFPETDGEMADPWTSP